MNNLKKKTKETKGTHHRQQRARGIAANTRLGKEIVEGFNLWVPAIPAKAPRRFMQNPVTYAHIRVAGTTIFILWAGSTRNVGFSLCDHTRVLTVSSETHLLQYSPFLKATFVIDRARHNHFKLRSHSTFSPLYSCHKALSSFATLNSSSTATLNLLLLLDTSLTVSVGGLLCLTLVCYLHWPYFNQFSV
jgi:hypothetical protein